jgi:PST family polysaccharide transporter
MIALGVRSGLQSLVVLGANVFLARKLDPGDYGVFGILHFAMSFFRLLSDTGLGAALVRKKEEPEEVELSTLWWFQLGFGVLLLALSFLSVPIVRKIWPSLPNGTEWLLPGLTVSLAFTMLQSVPFLILERDVRFGWVGTLEFVGTLVFYAAAIILAIRGAGAASLVWATVCQAGLISLAAHLVQPWRPKFMFQFAKIRALLRFGSALQGTQIIGYINGAVTPLLVGARLGKDAVGVVQFAESTAWFPTQVVGVVRRVYFPYLCRLQSNPEAFTREFELAILLSAVPTFFFFGLFLGTAPAIISIVYGAKWLVALPALYVYSFGFCALFFSWIGDAALAALNQATTLLKICLLTCTVNWIATVVATTVTHSPFGFACGFLVHLILSPLLIYLALRARLPNLRIFGKIRGLFGASLILAGTGRLTLPYIHGIPSLIAWVLLAVSVFLTLALALDRALRVVVIGFVTGWLSTRRRQAA